MYIAYSTYSTHMDNTDTLFQMSQDNLLDICYYKCIKEITILNPANLGWKYKTRKFISTFDYILPHGDCCLSRGFLVADWMISRCNPSTHKKQKINLITWVSFNALHTGLCGAIFFIRISLGENTVFTHEKGQLIQKLLKETVHFRWAKLVFIDIKSRQVGWSFSGQMKIWWKLSPFATQTTYLFVKTSL